VPIVDDFEEIATLLTAERREAPIVKNEQIHSGERFQEPRVVSITAGSRQALEQRWQAMVQDERLSQHALWPSAQTMLLTPDHLHIK
jgi:hypothetical protein